MADHDPISGSSTPSKRRKLNDGKAWDSQDDSGEEFTVEDFNTVATMPTTQRRNQLQYTTEQFHSDLRTNDQSAARTYITQPTQTMRLSSPLPLPHTSDVLVDRSSPVVSPPPKAPPQPIKRALSKPSILASAIAPPGTAFRAPAGIQRRPAQTPVQVDSDSDDPPIHHSSDEGETQGLRSTLKPTNFRQGGRDLNPTPNQISIKESPRPPAAKIATFTDFVSQFGHNSASSNTRPADDMSGAYGNTSRRPRPEQAASARIPPKQIAAPFNTIEDLPNYVLQKKVLAIQAVLPQESVQRCFDALKRKGNNVDDAMEWLTADEERDAPGEDDEDDELASSSPVVKRGLAMKIGQKQTQSSQPIRSAKQEVTAPTVRIADKYGAFQANRRQSQPESPDEDKPRRRLIQRGRQSARESPEPSPPPRAPPQPAQRSKKPQVVPSDNESEPDSEASLEEIVEVQSGLSPREQRLLQFFNECSVQDLADLAAQPEDKATFLIAHRPFPSLNKIRKITDATQTKSGRESNARTLGDRMVELCGDMLDGYNAVDTLVERCESLAVPIHATLKEWGATASISDGEVDLMHVDHDSGIGTPTSSTTSEIPSASSKKRFLNQPASMSSDAADTLKDYQLVGLNWLNLLWSQKLSCMLADEMGLGKTCQVIAFLAHLQEMEVDGVHLIVVPSSTLENWLRELQRFAPKLNVIAYYGTETERLLLQERIESEFNDIDVIVTTINMAVNENDNRFLRKQVDPLVCVFDEAHALRNRTSARYKQLSKIPATFRILLTGTPLQNNLKELMSILAFMMPRIFEDHRNELEFIFQYKATTKDISTANAALLSSQRIARARSMMTPFILRRKKENVLDLPPKHNHVEYCEMTTSQATYYNDLLEEFQQYVHGPGTKSKTKRTVSSNMLMALRKAAIHPLLARRLYSDEKIDKIVAELLKHPEFAENKPHKIKEYLSGDHHQSFKGGDFGLHRFCQERDYLHKYTLKKREWTRSSGKVEKFEELITRFVSNGDRILVFSQFTSMMDILEHVLENLKIRFMRLDGSTDVQIRQDMLDKFADDLSIPVFMLSTKAGGAGINLACANKVIIFDSGFNPQDDIQAENRAHRIGQKKEVDVYRLVTRDTIEMQIQAVNDLKIALGEQVADDESGKEKQAEKANEKMVADMFVESLKKEEDTARDTKVGTTPAAVDIRDAFKCGLESAGVRVSSKQAQF